MIGFIKNLIKKNDVEEYIITEDKVLGNGDILREGSNFIIDFIKNDKARILFPENTISRTNKYKEELIPVQELSKFARKRGSKKHESLQNHIEYLENYIKHEKEKSTDIGKVMKQDEENGNLLETLGYLEAELEKSENDNELLKEKIKEQDKSLFKITQENSAMEKHIKELESDLKDYYKTQDKLLDKYEDKYNEKMMVVALEKTTEDKETYKKVINKLCDKYNIEHSEVFSIIDNIKSEKDNNNIQRER